MCKSKNGRRRRQQDKISILYWSIRTRNSVSPSSPRSFRTQFYWSFTTGQCIDSEQFLRVLLSDRMCDQPYEQGTLRSARAWFDQTTSCIVQAAKVKRHHDTVYWVDKGLGFCRTRSNAVIFYDTPSLLYPEGYLDGIWRNHIRESLGVTSTSSKDFLHRELDEEIGFRRSWKQQKLPIQPKLKKPNYQERRDPWVSNHQVRSLGCSE